MTDTMDDVESGEVVAHLIGRLYNLILDASDPARWVTEYATGDSVTSVQIGGSSGTPVATSGLFLVRSVIAESSGAASQLQLGSYPVIDLDPGTEQIVQLCLTLRPNDIRKLTSTTAGKMRLIICGEQLPLLQSQRAASVMR